MPLHTSRGAEVEIVEYRKGGSGSGPLIRSAVLVNGVDVGFIKNDSLVIRPGDGLRDMVEVSMTLWPSKVTIHAVVTPDDDPGETVADTIARVFPT